MQHYFNTRTGQCQFCRAQKNEAASECPGKVSAPSEKPVQTFVSNIHPSAYYYREEIATDSNKLVVEIGFATFEELQAHMISIDKGK